MRKHVPSLFVSTLLFLLPAADAFSAGPNPPSVETALVEQKPYRASVMEIGEAEAEDSVELVARVKGYLKKIHFKEGQLVKKGDLLFELDAREFEAQVAYAKADVERKTAQRDHALAEEQRQKTLIQQDAVSQREYDRAAAKLAESAAEVSAAQATLKLAELDLEYCRIFAPFDGYVGFTACSEGNVVGPESGPLASIQRIGRTKVGFNIPENALAKLRANAKAKHADPKNADVELYDQSGNRISFLDADGKPRDAVGKIDSFDNRINPKTGTLKIKAIFEDPERNLIPGAFVKVKLYLESAVPCPAIPLSAASEDVTGIYVCVVKEDKENPGTGVVERRLLKDVKARDREFLYLNGGVEPGERIIVSGLQRVRPGAKCSFRVPQAKDAQASPAVKQ